MRGVMAEFIEELGHLRRKGHVYEEPLHPRAATSDPATDAAYSSACVMSSLSR
jgi:hypothetical protein